MNKKKKQLTSISYYYLVLLVNILITEKILCDLRCFYDDFPRMTKYFWSNNITYNSFDIDIN